LLPSCESYSYFMLPYSGVILLYATLYLSCCPPGYIGTIFELQFHNYQRKREETLTWESLERRLLACRWTAENSRGPSNSKVISSGCPPKELLSQPTHLLPARTTEAQTSAALECHSNRRSYTNIMLHYCPFATAYCIHDVSGDGCTPVFMLSVLIIIKYLSSFHFEIRSYYWHLSYLFWISSQVTNQVTMGWVRVMIYQQKTRVQSFLE